jgi:hypothetical protein
MPSAESFRSAWKRMTASSVAAPKSSSMASGNFTFCRKIFGWPTASPVEPRRKTGRASGVAPESWMPSIHAKASLALRV